LQHGFMKPIFFLLLRRMLDFWNFCYSQSVLSVFSSSSQWVIDIFFKCPMCSQCHFTLFHMLCIMFCSWNLYRLVNK
jgi:hypothetical protein